MELDWRIKSEVERLLQLAGKADGTVVPDGLDVPAEFARAPDRLRLIDEAKLRLKTREEQRIAAEDLAFRQTEGG